MNPLSQNCCLALLEELLLLLPCSSGRCQSLQSKTSLFLPSLRSTRSDPRSLSLLCLGAAQGTADTQFITSRLVKKQNRTISTLWGSTGHFSRCPRTQLPLQLKINNQSSNSRGSLWATATAPCSTQRQTPGTARWNRRARAACPP